MLFLCLSKAKPQKLPIHYDKIQQTSKLFSHITFVIYNIIIIRISDLQPSMAILN